jgi:hypothetical protein
MPQLARPSNDFERWQSLAECLGLIAAMYRNLRAEVQSYLGNDASVESWVWRDDDWPPAYGTIRTLVGDLHVFIAGTTNLQQWSSHIYTSWGRRFPGQTGIVNGWWLDVARGILREIDAQAEDTNRNRRIILTGHSYGGAVAHLISLLLAERLGSNRVELVTFGAPKVIAPTINVPRASTHLRAISLNDPVSPVPPQIPAWLSATDAPEGTFSIGFPAYVHEGEEITLLPDGSVNNPSYSTPSPLPELVGVGVLNEHSTENYAGRLIERYRVFGPQRAPESAALSWLRSIFTGEQPTQQQSIFFGESVTEPDGRLVSIPNLGQASEPVPMAIQPATPLTGGRVYKATVFFNGNRWGWTESVYLHTTGDVNDLAQADLFSFCRRYAQIRRQMLHRSYSVEAIRTSDADTDADSRMQYAPDLGLGAGLKTTAPFQQPDPSRGLFYRTFDASSTISDVRILRGLPAEWDDATIENGAFVAAYASELSNLTDQLFFLMTGRDFTAQAGTLTPCTRSYDVRPEVQQVNDIASVTQDELRRLVVIVTGANINYAVGQRVHLSVQRDPLIRGISGEATIVDREVVAGNTRLTLNRSAGSAGERLAILRGTLSKREVAYYAIRECVRNRLGNRNTGRAFFGTRGRRPNKRC